MDAVEIILYVVIMIIWVIVQNARKKKVKRQQEAQRRQMQSQDDSIEMETPPKSPDPQEKSLIDEIIRELKSEETDIEVESPAQDRTPEMTQNFEPKTYEDREVKNYEKELKEIKDRKKRRDSERFESYKIGSEKLQIDEEEEENEYASLLFEDPDSPRKAIILSEILNRKHF